VTLKESNDTETAKRYGIDLQFPFRVDRESVAVRVSERLAASPGRSQNEAMINEPAKRLKLRDGRVVDVRPLERCDRRLLAAAIERLSDDSRYLRFASPKPAMTDRELDQLVDVDHRDHEALLAIDPLTGRGVAVARYIRVPGESGVVELAATVADDWQGIGLGSALLAEVTRRALDEGHSAFRAYVLAINRPAIAMLHRAGFRARARAGALLDYELADWW
jgi:GNAT superfamily N-acetyltransferase